jgi:hypothetical protein
MFATFVLATMLASANAVTSQASGLVTYDDFGQKFELERLTIFNTISPENRAALVREQITRWQTKNSARLTSDQQQLIDDALNVIEADMYDVNSPRRSELQAQMKAVEARVRTLFTIEDARQAFTIHGDYIRQ